MRAMSGPTTTPSRRLTTTRPPNAGFGAMDDVPRQRSSGTFIPEPDDFLHRYEQPLATGSPDTREFATSSTRDMNSAAHPARHPVPIPEHGFLATAPARPTPVCPVLRPAVTSLCMGDVSLLPLHPPTGANRGQPMYSETAVLTTPRASTADHYTIRTTPLLIPATTASTPQNPANNPKPTTSSTTPAHPRNTKSKYTTSQKTWLVTYIQHHFPACTRKSWNQIQTAYNLRYPDAPRAISGLTLVYQRFVNERADLPEPATVDHLVWTPAMDAFIMNWVKTHWEYGVARDWEGFWDGFWGVFGGECEDLDSGGVMLRRKGEEGARRGRRGKAEVVGRCMDLEGRRVGKEKRVAGKEGARKATKRARISEDGDGGVDPASLRSAPMNPTTQKQTCWSWQGEGEWLRAHDPTRRRGQGVAEGTLGNRGITVATTSKGTETRNNAENSCAVIFNTHSTTIDPTTAEDTTSDEATPDSDSEASTRVDVDQSDSLPDIAM